MQEKEKTPVVPDEDIASSNGHKSLADPFDLEALRDQALENLQVERVLRTVPVRRPNKTEFFRVHPEYTSNAFTLEAGEDMHRDTYWVAPNMRADLRDYLYLARLYTCVSRSGVTFLWPAKLPDESGSGSGQRWHSSALDVAEMAKTSWLRMRGNRDLGAYEPFIARGDLGEPEWPDKTLAELIRLAFRDHIIDSPEHPVVQKLYGLI